MEASECGAAALGIILSHYGRIVPLAELRQACGVSRDGSNASNVLKASKSYGLEAKGFKEELENLPDIEPPYIVFWQFNHFLVVEGFSGQKVYLNDPANGRISISWEEFDEGYTGVILVMEPGSEFTKGGHKVNVVLSLRSRLGAVAGALIYCMIAGFFLTLVKLLVPVFSQIFIDEILIQQRTSWIRPLLLSMAIAMVFQGTLTFLQLHYLRRLNVKLAVGMYGRFLWHVLRLPIDFYAQRFAGEIGQRTRLNDQVASVLSGRLATTAIDSVMVVFLGIVMFQYDGLLSTIVILSSAINIFTLQMMNRYRVDANQKIIQDYGKASGTSIAGLQNIETLKASGVESDFFAKWSGYYTKATNNKQELSVSNQILSGLPSVLGSISSILILVLGGFRIIDGSLSIGMLIAYRSIVSSFQEPLGNLVSFATTIQELEGNIIRLDDVLNNPIDPSLDDTNNAERNRHQLSDVSPYLKGHIDIRDLTFGYNRLDPPLIENFNLTIKPGQRVALVGSSGSGKSTIAKIITGLYKPWSGEILFDGYKREQTPSEVLTSSIAVVEQDVFLFSGTVRDNLSLWDRTIPHDDLRQACEDAAIDDVINSLPRTYNSELEEGGGNLSGGQKQRLEIARSLVYNPSILVMDEATSALDTETEKIIDGNLRRRGCTCIIVAHRLSTIRDCDEIIVLEQGKVVQRGKHEEMRQVEGAYSRLIASEGNTATATATSMAQEVNHG